MFLARTVGRTAKTDEFLQSITKDEFEEWLAEFILQPWDSKLADLHAALLTCTLRNTWRGEKQKVTELQECLLFPMGFTPAEEEREQTDEEMAAVAQRFALMTQARFGAK